MCWHKTNNNSQSLSNWEYLFQYPPGLLTSYSPIHHFAAAAAPLVVAIVEATAAPPGVVLVLQADTDDNDKWTTLATRWSNTVPARAPMPALKSRLESSPFASLRFPRLPSPLQSKAVLYMATKTLYDGDDTHKLNWTASNFDNFVYASRVGDGAAAAARETETKAAMEMEQQDRG